MTFVDTLAFQLFSLAFVSGALFYSGLVGYVTYLRYGPRRTFEHLRSQAVPLAGLGVVIAAIGLWGEIAWPLPGSYNILFFDPYLLLGVILIGYAVCLGIRWRTQYIGLLAAMTGMLSIYYGANAYNLGLTKDPLEMFLLYVALGGTAIFTFPVTLWIDRYVLTPLISPDSTPGGLSPDSKPSAATSMEVKVLFGLFLFFLLFALGSAIATLFVGGNALSSHLSYAP
jgi:putative membrane protein